VFVREKVGFRPIEEGDLETLRALRNDMTTLLQLGSVDMVSGEQQAEWWRGLSRNRTDSRYTIVEAETGAVIGMVRVQNIDLVNAHCEIGLDIVPAYRGRGFGTAGYEMILEYLFDHRNMHMVYLRVADFNDRARGLYERLGFVETGRYNEYLYRHGRYWDYILMTMTRDQYQRRGRPR
jgi:RimJ/RimL family protein N-acetyltransferase